MDLTYGHWEIKKKKKEEMLELRIDSLTLNSGRLQGGSLKRPNGLRYNREIVINIPIGDAHPPNTVSPVRLF